MSKAGDSVENLVMDYHEARDDERYYLALQGTVVTLALTGVSLLGALASQVAKETTIPAPMIAGAPLIILCVLAFGQAISAQAVLRSFYMRSLEREIRDRLGPDADLSAYPDLQSPTYIEMTVSYTTVARGSNFGRWMAVFIFASLWIVFGGLTLFLSLKVSPPWQIAMAVIYGGGAVFIFRDTMRVQVSGRSFFLRHVAATRRRLDETLKPHGPTGAHQKTDLWKYLLLPRPDDLIKAVFVVAGIALALISAPEHSSFGSRIPQLALFVVSIEWLVYQSRYQWNDIRGLHEDELAPSRSDRRRLPGGVASIPKSVLVMVLRIVGVFWVAALAWPGEKRISHADLVMFLGIALIYLTAVLYEEIRQRARGYQVSSEANLALTVVAVGLGYAIRFALGWWGAGGASGGLAVGLVLVAAWGLGVFFVSLGWILEFADYVHSIDDLGRYVVDPAIAVKPHLLTLAKVCGIDHVVSPDRARETVDGGALRMLTLVRFTPWSPWIFGSAIWYLCISAAIGPLLNLPGFHLLPWGVAAAIMVALPLKRRGGLLPQLLAGATVMAGVAWNLAEDRWQPVPLIESSASIVVCFVVSGLAVLLYISFYLATYRSTRGAARKLLRLVVRAWQGFAGWFVGSGRGSHPLDKRVEGRQLRTGPADEPRPTNPES